MIGIVHAETLKLLRHRGIWGLVWIVPIGLVLLWLIATVLHFSHVMPSRGARPPANAAQWIAGTALTWSFAANSFGRYLIAGFAALAFAGEYGWSTWKLIVPHRSRGALIAAKYIVVLGLELAAYVLAAVIGIIIALIDSVLVGDVIPPGITLGALLSAHTTGLATALLPMMLTIAYAAAAAIFFRSTMAAVIVGIVAITLERLAATFAVLIPKWVLLVLPSVYLDNLHSWIATGQGMPVILDGAPVELGWLVSAVVLVVWIAGLIAVTCAQFRRQDLT